MTDSFRTKKERILKMKNGVGVKHLIDEAYEILGNPIMMFDTSYTLMAMTDVVTDDWVWNEIVSLGTFSHETVDFFNKEHFIEAFAVSEIVALLKSEHLKYERANGKLFDKDSVQLGNISVVASKNPFEDGDMELIELFCEVLSVELQNSEYYERIERVYQDTIISKLLSGEVTDTAGEIPRGFCDDLKENLYIAVADITQYDKTNTHLAYFRDLMKKLQGSHKYYVHMNNIVILISTDDENLHIENDFSELIGFFEKNGIFAGISSKFQNIFEMQRHFKEAIAALNYGQDSKRRQNIFRYDDLRIEHFLLSGAGSFDDAISPVVMSIKQYDTENNTGLLDTLYTYLLYGLNLPLASNRLGLSDHELSRKLKALETGFAIDFTDGNALNNLFLSIKLYNYTMQ